MIRVATPDDAPAFAAIYAPIVTETHISFEEHAPGEAEMRERIVATLTWTPWLAAIVGDRIQGTRMRAGIANAQHTAGQSTCRSISIHAPVGAASAARSTKSSSRCSSGRTFTTRTPASHFPTTRALVSIARSGSNRSGSIGALVGRPARGTTSPGSAATCAQTAMTPRRLPNRFPLRGLGHRRLEPSLGMDRVSAELIEDRVLRRRRTHVAGVDLGIEVRDEVT